MSEDPMRIDEKVNENGDKAFDSTGSDCLDFFSSACGGTEYGAKGKTPLNNDDSAIYGFLDRMWAESPITTLKLIFYKRDCRGGQKEKRLFHVCFNWLLEYHNETAMANLGHIPFFGYWKDLLQLVKMNSFNQALLDSVATLFADQLNLDRMCLMDVWDGLKPQENISLCAKWAPSPGRHFDKSTKITKLIAKKMGFDHNRWAESFRKRFTSPLRAYVNVVEREMCANNWSKIDYSKVPSVAMKLYRKTFEKHDSERFNEWVKSLGDKTKKTKINVSQLYAHEIVNKYMSDSGHMKSELDQFTEEQWLAFERETAKLGTLEKCLVISDTSSSMSGIPMLVSVTLGVLITRLTKAPFNNQVITFNSQPAIVQLEGKTLHENVKEVAAIPWGGSTNLDATFRLILDRAVKAQTRPEDMPTRVFLLTDNQFNSQVTDWNSSAFERIVEMYKLKGYTPPQIIFWNLRGDTKTHPVRAHDQGVCMVSGFSVSILKTLLAGNLPDPVSVMNAAISDARYDRLVIVD